VTWLLVIAACSGGDEGDARPVPLDARVAPSDANIPASPAKIGLTVEGARRLLRVGPVPSISPRPGLGNIYLGVRLSLHNIGEDRPLPVNETTFSLQTTANVYYQQSKQTALTTGPCPMGAAVAKSGSVTCEVIFEVPWAAKLAGLAYSDDAGRTTSEPILAVEPELGLCGSLPGSSTPSDCSFCLNDGPTSFGCRTLYVAMEAACGDATPFACFRGASCPAVSESCAASDTCRTAVADAQQCLFDKCSFTCR
jgi:hypothetical protein